MAEQAMRTAPDQQRSGLRRDSVSLTGATVIGVSFIAPAAGVAFLPQVVAAQAGGAVPLVYLIALVGSLCLAYTISQFARWVPSAGSFFAFNSLGIGPSAGFLSGWLLLAGYLGGLPQNMLAFGNSLSAVLAKQLDIGVPWWAFTIGGTVLIAAIAIGGLGLSVRVDITMLVVEAVVIAVLAGLIIFSGGAHGNTAEVFTPSAGGVHGGSMLFGLVFAFSTFVGFESVATVSEETKDARRNIPRAILGSVLVTGIFFVFVTYAITIGFGPDQAGALASDPLPLDTLAAGNGLTRVIFAMSRDGALPRRLGKVHPRRGTPYAAVILVSVVALVLAIGLGLAVGPYPEGYSYIGAFAGLPVLVLFVLVSFALARYVSRHRRREFRVVKHLLIPGIGAVLAGLAIYGSYDPMPEGAFLWINIGFVVYLLAGILLSLYLRRKRPERMREFGKVLGE